MNIYAINPTLIDQGRQVYSAAMNAGLNTGAALIPGAIIAAIEAGRSTTSEIVCDVANASRCKVTTVAVVLKSLSTEATPEGLWTLDKTGHYQIADRAAGGPLLVMAS